MSKTTIQWTDETLNPSRGCEAVSPGCLNCYAARTATRFSGEGEPFEGLARMKSQPDDRQGRKRPSLAVWTGDITLVPKALLEALRWSPRKHKRVFVGSVTDIFHCGEALTDAWEIHDGGGMEFKASLYPVEPCADMPIPF
jgi:protein gp37